MFWTRKKPVAHAHAPELYRYRHGQIFTNGAEEYVLDQPQTLPIILYKGAGSAAGQLRVLQHPQVYANLAVATSSLGGLQSGQLILQPLISDPNSTNQVTLNG